MEKESGMEEHGVTPALQECPQFRSQLPFLSSQNQAVIGDYVACGQKTHAASHS
jgi:hypothetical protein